MEKTTLVIMAAGIGSRFGQGIKQLTSFGPNGEIIMDYSIYDAKRAGFDRVLFVIRKDLEQDFKEIIGNRIAEQIEVNYTFQELTGLPKGFSLPEGRKKPWGTGQAILACKGHLNGPFAVINADDYYGPSAFSSVHDYLTGDLDEQDMCMSGFILKNTLSDNGGVTRGICRLDENGSLVGIDETKHIIKTAEGAAVLDKDGDMERPLNADGLVSMNFWGFQLSFLDTLEEMFTDFLEELTPESELTEEFLLPTIVDRLINGNRARVKVLPTEDSWFGVTYQEDVPTVRESFEKLIEDNVYPRDLWGK